MLPEVRNSKTLRILDMLRKQGAPKNAVAGFEADEENDVMPDGTVQARTNLHNISQDDLDTLAGKAVARRRRRPDDEDSGEEPDPTAA